MKITVIHTCSGDYHKAIRTKEAMERAAAPEHTLDWWFNLPKDYKGDLTEYQHDCGDPRHSFRVTQLAAGHGPYLMLEDDQIMPMGWKQCITDTTATDPDYAMIFWLTDKQIMAQRIGRVEYREHVPIKELHMEKEHRYVICGKEAKSNHPDFETQYENTELGWEVPCGNVMSKSLLAMNRLRRTDTIVTLPGREFLYRESFNRVITWKDFCNRRGYVYGQPHPDVRGEDVVDLVHWQCDKGQFWPRWYFSRGGHFGLPSAIPEILKFQQSSDNILGGGCALALRYRPHESRRNTDNKFAKELIKLLSKQYTTIYLVGLGIPDELVTKKVKRITLQQYVTLMAGGMLECTYTPYSGPMALANMYSVTPVVCFPHEPCPSMGMNWPSGSGWGLNFLDNKQTLLPVGAEPAAILKAGLELAKS